MLSIIPEIIPELARLSTKVSSSTCSITYGLKLRFNQNNEDCPSTILGKPHKPVSQNLTRGTYTLSTVLNS